LSTLLASTFKETPRYLVESLEGRIPPELHQRLVELVMGRDIDWSADLKRALGREMYLDVCEAIVIMDRER
jgi:predicted metal-dependent peptidase